MRRVQSTRSVHKHPGKITSFHVVVGIMAAAGLVVLASILFAPDKPPPPPSSEIAYQKRPNAEERELWGPYSSAPRPRNRNVSNVTQEEQYDETEEEAKYQFVFFGVVTSADSGEPLRMANLWCRRQMTEDEKADQDALVEEAKESGDVEKRDEAFRSFDEFRIRRSARTDDDGRFKITVPKKGEYKFNCDAYGYIPERDRMVIFPEDEEEKFQVDFSMSLGASISGRVTESGTSTGAVGVRVIASEAVRNRNWGQDAKTDENGRYTITGLTVGAYSVILNLHDSPYQVSSLIPSRSVDIDVPRQKKTGIDFTVEPAGTVWGYVTGPEKEPIRSAKVILCTSESIVSQALKAMTKQAPPIGDNTEKDGYYELVGVPLNEEWRVYVLDDDWAPQLSDPFVLTASQRFIRVDLFVPPGSNIYGRVVSPDGQPIARADIACFPGYSKFLSKFNTAHAFREEHSKQDGSFLIPQLPAGEYQIIAFEEGYKVSAFGEPVYPDGYSDIHNVEVVLTPIESGDYGIYGMVMDTNGQPIDDVRIQLMGMGTESLSASEMSTKSDELGLFGFMGIEPGFFMLSADKNGYAPVITHDVKLDEPTDIVMEAAGGVNGVVLVRETNRPPVGKNYRVNVTPQFVTGGSFLYEMADRRSHSFNNEDGSFSFSLAPGDYRLEARCGTLTPGTTQVSVTSGRETSGVTIYVSEKGGSIRGRVRMVDGASPRGAIASVVKMGGGQLADLVGLFERSGGRGEQVGSDGSFEFKNLAEGTYTVMAQASGYAQGRSEPVEVSFGRAVNGVDVLLGHGGSLQGYVMQDGELLAGALVTVVGSGVTKMGNADRNGQYMIEGIPQGKYMASAVQVDEIRLGSFFAPLHAEVEIAEGQTTFYNFGEEIGGVLEGLCQPPPKFGSMAIVVVHLPGEGFGLSGLDFNDLLGAYGEGSSMAYGLIGMSPVSGDGYFKIPNLPIGTFDVEVLYGSALALLSGQIQTVHAETITITGEERKYIEVKLPNK